MGRSCITPIDEATVEIGTEALFKQLLALQSQTMNGVAVRHTTRNIAHDKHTLKTRYGLADQLPIIGS